MKTYFQRIDFDQDGQITRKDFEGMASRFAETGKLDQQKATDLNSTLTAVWDKYLSVVGGGDSIGLDAFINSMKTLVKDASLKGTLEGPLPLFFHAVDSNNDGKIDKGEYGEFFRILGVDEKLAPESFDAIDTDKDGLLSLDEFKTAGSDFFITDDESHPTKLFWGPLV